MEKEARATEKAILANIPDCLRVKKSGIEPGLALAAGPLGNLVAKKADRPKMLAWHGGGGFCLKRELSRISYKKLGGLRNR
jgi:hypothetical protein